LSEFEKLKIVTRYELLKQLRRKRFYGALALTVLAQVLTIALYKGLDIPGKIHISDSPELFAIFSTSITTIAIIGSVFFSGDAIASEFEHKTGYILFPNPVKKITIVTGKYIACFIATAAILGVAYLISAFSLLGFYQSIPSGILSSLAIALALACCVLSIAFAFSSFMKGGMGATIATLLAFIMILPIVSTSLVYAGYNPWFLPNYAGNAVTATYGLQLGQVFGGFGEGRGARIGTPDPVTSFIVLLVYAAVLFQISIWLTKRREMV
jgi:ABC-2 type transport system permease protein